MKQIKQFDREVKDNITDLGKDKELAKITSEWIKAIIPHHYTHNFSWLGRPIIQFPQDIVVMQELIWRVKPDLIIETGIAHGGSLIFSASMLAMLDYQDAFSNGTTLNPHKPSRRVLGVDIEIREHNRLMIESHAMSKRIDVIEGSSTDANVIAQVRNLSEKFNRVLVVLDSNHTHNHVLAELEAYAPLTSIGSYCVVFDTAIEDLPASFFPDRPWGPGDNPKTAVMEYLKRCSTKKVIGADGKPLLFKVDKDVEHKALITVAPDGYLLRI